MKYKYLSLPFIFFATYLLYGYQYENSEAPFVILTCLGFLVFGTLILIIQSVKGFIKLKLGYILSMPFMILGSNLLFSSQGREEFLGALIGIGLIGIGIVIVIINIIVTKIKKNRMKGIK
jgi:hypothetical protein